MLSNTALIANYGAFGSGWYNIDRTLHCYLKEAAHVDVIMANPKEFRVNIDPEVADDWRKMADIKHEMDNNYSSFYDQGWIRYYWAISDNESSFVCSGKFKDIDLAYRNGMILELIAKFNTTYLTIDAIDKPDKGQIEVNLDGNIIALASDVLHNCFNEVNKP